MTSKSPVRACDDVDEQALSYAEVKALCAGNPLIKEKMDLDIEVARLRVLKSDYQNKHYRMEDMLLKQFPKRIEAQKGIIERQERDIGTAAANPVTKESFPGMEIGGIRYEKRDEAGEAILAQCRFHVGEQEIGSYRGFGMELSYNVFSASFQLKLRGAYSYDVTLGQDARGNITRIDNVIGHIEKDLEWSKQALKDLYAQQEQTREELSKPFPQQEELTQKEARLAELDAELNMDKGSAGEEEKEDHEEAHPEENSDPVTEMPTPLDISFLKNALMMPTTIRDQKIDKILGDFLANAHTTGNEQMVKMIRTGREQGIPAVELARRIITGTGAESKEPDGNRIVYYQPARVPAMVMEAGASYRTEIGL